MLITLCVAVLIVQVDTSVVNLAVGPIGHYFGSEVRALQWVVDSYNLVYASLLLSGGLLADLYGRRLALMLGAAVFTAGSLLCALAPSVSLLIGGRAIAGIGAALLLPASLAIIRVAWPEGRERRRVLGIWTACNGLALAVGPTVGGMLLEGFGWRSIFILVVPFGFAALGLSWYAIPESSDPRDRQFDAGAQFLGVLALGAIALGAIESHHDTSISAIAFLVAALSLGWFVKVEARRGPTALVPLDLFRSARFRAALIATSAMTFGMYGLFFLLPLVWQTGGFLGPLGAGIALMPMALIFVCVSPFSGSLTARLGDRFTTAGGVAVIGCGLLCVGATAGQASILGAEIGLALTGLGMGIATGPLMEVAVGSVSAQRSGTAAAMINVARMVGATLGVAIMGALFALVGGGAEGLRWSMVIGGLVQLACAAAAWIAMKP